MLSSGVRGTNEAAALPLTWKPRAEVYNGTRRVRTSCCVYVQVPPNLQNEQRQRLNRIRAKKSNIKQTRGQFKSSTKAHIDRAGHGLSRPRCRERKRLPHTPQAADAEKGGGRGSRRLGHVANADAATASDRAKQTEHVVPADAGNNKKRKGRVGEQATKKAGNT